MEFNQLHSEQQGAFVTSMRHLVNQEFDTPYMILTAPGGHGKTATIKSMMKMIEKHPIVRGSVLALTGRACSQLIKSGLSARTCHSILYEPILDFEGNLIRFDKRTNISDIKSEVGDFIIVDEASMITKEIHDTLVSLGLPILYVGDASQLPPVDKDNPDFNVMEFDDCPYLELTVNHRQTEGSGIEELCKILREENSLPRMKRGDLKFIPKAGLTPSYFAKNEFDIVLCGTNKTRKKINTQVRQAKGFHGDLPQEGEQIVCLQNTVIAEHKISNGELFVIDGAIYGEEISKYFVTSIDSGKSQTVNIENHCWDSEFSRRQAPDGTPLCSFAYGYCISVWKSQGSQFDKVLFIDEDVSFFIKDRKNFRYTAVSRASKYLTIGV